MKSGAALGMAVFLTALILTPTGIPEAQSLGLGTGSRASAPEDSSGGEFRPDRKDESSPPRKTQFNKRLGLTARRQFAFDPKVFESRGRDLQGQFYEIGTPAGPKQMLNDAQGGAAPGSNSGSLLSQSRPASRQWMIWMGVAGAAGVSAGAIGYFMMTNSHPASTPPDIPLNLDDGP